MLFSSDSWTAGDSGDPDSVLPGADRAPQAKLKQRKHEEMAKAAAEAAAKAKNAVPSPLLRLSGSLGVSG